MTNGTQALLERLNKQVEVGMFAMDSPVTFRECHDTIEALSSALAAAERALKYIKKGWPDSAAALVAADAIASLPAKQEPSQ